MEEIDFLQRLFSKGVYPTLQFFIKNKGKELSPTDLIKSYPAPPSSIYHSIRFLMSRDIIKPRLTDGNMVYSLSTSKADEISKSIKTLLSVQGDSHGKRD